MNLIPGEPTVGSVFAGMGLVYVVAAALVFLRKGFFYPLTLFYAVALLLAYAVTRDSLPVEPIGFVIKGDEAALVAVLVGLLRRPASS